MASALFLAFRLLVSSPEVPPAEPAVDVVSHAVSRPVEADSEFPTITSKRSLR
jgi:hypothetical protein